MAFHVDFKGAIGNVRQMGDGSLRISARLARTGTQEYRYPGKPDPVLEYRDPSEVFHPESIESVKGVTVTQGHPGRITAETWKTHAVGNVGDQVHQDGEFLAADVIVKDHATIAKVLAKELVELSMGYSCDVVPVEGKAWSYEQKNIRANHCALLPKGAGRAGSEVCLRMDSAYSETEEIKDPNAPTKPPPPPETKPKADSLDYGMELTEALKKVAELEAAKADAEKAKAEAVLKADAAEKAAADLKAKTEADAKMRQNAADEAKAKADADKRAELIATIAQVSPEYKADGKSLDALVERAEMALETQAKHKAAGLHQDGTGAPSEKNAHQRMIERNANAWKGEDK